MELINGEVVITNRIDLQEFVSQKNKELEMIGMEIVSAQSRQQAILSELEDLIK